MKVTKQTLKCTECPYFVTIEIGSAEFLDGTGSLTSRLATHLGWDAVTRRCPIHRGKP